MANDAGRGVCGKASDSRRHFIGRPPIIAIEHRYDFALALRECMIKSGCLATIGFAKDANVGREFGKDFRCAIGGTVIDYKNFAIIGGKILRQDASDRLFDEALVVIGVNQYADKRSCHSVISDFVRTTSTGKLGV